MDDTVDLATTANVPPLVERVMAHRIAAGLAVRVETEQGPLMYYARDEVERDDFEGRSVLAGYPTCRLPPAINPPKRRQFRHCAGVLAEISAGHVAEYHAGDDRLLPYGYGATVAECLRDAERQFAGLGPRMRARMMAYVTTRPVGADEASEILEMLATPW